MSVGDAKSPDSAGQVLHYSIRSSISYAHKNRGVTQRGKKKEAQETREMRETKTRDANGMAGTDANLRPTKACICDAPSHVAACAHHRSMHRAPQQPTHNPPQTTTPPPSSISVLLHHHNILLPFRTSPHRAPSVQTNPGRGQRSPL
ncbi:hypothetical protein L249_0278 [Ophiocordyceps polyrhachis-furcata BCC 54312]|uniref:Uncharacterized protein n=1 Tax=Ophiocordyceps polyrhachis-furcata BCC 54312 TaxID=1330021 RepID=A0A367LD16_9HYPO|nr:hypothetical protein L249_0278 [Ophiocordyceps polyrhachis-furcata BCC 54312]